MKYSIFALIAIAILSACAPQSTEPTITTPEPAPETTESTDDKRVTLADYEALEMGMTLADVEEILGTGTEVSRSEVAGIESRIVQWVNPGGANITIALTNDEVTSINQFGLQ